jgi:hypothetical protein
MIKKGLTFLGLSIGALALTTGTASAHFCYNAKRSEQGNEKVAERSNGYATYAELLAEFGLCESGIEYVEDNGPDSIPLDVPVNSHATMAGGTFNSGNDAQGIDHIEATDEEWEEFDAVINEAFADCEAE